MSILREYIRKMTRATLGKRSPEELEKWLNASRTLYFFSAVTTFMYIIHMRNLSQDEKEKRSLIMGEAPVQEKSLFNQFFNVEPRPDKVYEYDKEQGWVIRENQEEKRGPRLTFEIYKKAYELQQAELDAGRELPEGALTLVAEKEIKAKQERLAANKNVEETPKAKQEPVIVAQKPEPQSPKPKPEVESPKEVKQPTDTVKDK